MSKPRVLNVGSRKYLLFDDLLTERKSGFILTMNPAIRTDEPVLLPDHPWEVGAIAGSITILEDEGIFKLWYAVPFAQSGLEDPEKLKEKFSSDEIKRFDPKTLADYLSQARFMLCYAISKDGIHWEKPNIGVFEFKGNRKNNIVFVAGPSFSVFKDPTAKPDKRYKMIYAGGPRLPHVYLKDNVPIKNIYHTIYGAYSADGIHWTSYKKPIIPWYTDTNNICYWDGRIKKYVAFVRWNENMIYKDGKTIILKTGGWKYRAIGRTESKNFQIFPPPIKIMEPSKKEREPSIKGLDYYDTSAIKYPFAVNSYFLFSSNFYHDSDMLDVHLATSRDGVHYERWRDPFLSLGKQDGFDSKMVFMATGMILVRNEIYMYYDGYNHVHGTRKRPPRSGAVGRVRVRPDGFVSQDASWSGGTLTTVPLTFKGNSLQVNMDANAGGWLKVELLNKAMNPIAGFTKKEADFLWGNDISKTVTWKGEEGLSRLNDKSIRLRFIGKAVKLYAFQFNIR